MDRVYLIAIWGHDSLPNGEVRIEPNQFGDPYTFKLTMTDGTWVILPREIFSDKVRDIVQDREHSTR